MPATKPKQPAVEAAKSRGARRKLATRKRLLLAAFELMADKGFDGLTIQEITDAADVGFGSFYNHFDSKEALHAAVIEQQYAAHADTLDGLVAAVADPAEIISISVRHTLMRAGREPVWGRFLAREGFSKASLSLGLGPRLLRDIEKGIDAGRFSTRDPMVSFVCCAGAVLAAISARLLQRAGDLPFELLAKNDDELAQRVAISVLRVLGLDASSAEQVARLPLPEWVGQDDETNA